MTENTSLIDLILTRGRRKAQNTAKKAQAKAIEIAREENRKLFEWTSGMIQEPYMPSEKALKEMANATQIGGDHYRNKTIQPWDAMEAWMSREEFIGFLWGNVIKYISRWKDKGGLEDLEKALHYLSKLIEVIRKD